MSLSVRSTPVKDIVEIMTPSKTHTAAAVVIPPPGIWRPIQAIRARHDRHVTRWMPHITLALPFRPKEEFPALVPLLKDGCAQIEPFTIELATVRFFDHGGERYTLWLDPEPMKPLQELQAAMASVLPDCNDVRLYEFGFTPHLSVGQANGREYMEKLLARLQADWKPLQFTVWEVSLVWRGQPPDDTFRVGATFPIGAGRRQMESTTDKHG